MADYFRSAFEALAQERSDLLAHAKDQSLTLHRHSASECVAAFLSAIPDGKFTAQWVADELSVGVGDVLPVVGGSDFVDIGGGWFFRRVGDE